MMSALFLCAEKGPGALDKTICEWLSFGIDILLYRSIIILMKRTFIQTQRFLKQWEALGFSDEDLLTLENMIMDNPKVGDVIPGSGGIRKMRFAMSQRGKRGGSRVCYVDFAVYETVYLMAVYGKGKKENLSENEKAELRKVVRLIEEYHERMREK